MLFITALLIIINLLFLALYYKRKRLPGEPPLADQLIPYIGGAVEFGKNPLGFLQKLQKKHGDVYTVTMSGWDHHVLMNPLDIANVLKCKTLKNGSVIGDFVTRMVGLGHSFHNPQSHKNDVNERNKVMSKTIHENLRSPDHVLKLFRSTRQVTVNTIKLILDKKLEAYENVHTVKLYQLCRDLVFYNTYNILLGSIPDEEDNLHEAKALHKEFMTFNEGAVRLLQQIPMHFLNKTKGAREKIIKIMKQIDISKRVNVSDFITQVIDTDKIAENQIHHMLIFMWAGQANTPPGLFWALYYILKHPHVRQKIMEEFKDLLKTKRQEADPDEANNNMPEQNVSLDDILNLEKEDLDKLILLNAALKEMVRLNGESIIVRKAIVDTVFTTHDGKQYKFRKGDHVMYYSPVMHLDPEVFEEPEKFKYDRFLEKPASTDDGTTADVAAPKVRPSFSKNGKRISDSRSVLTFGFGVGMCPGRFLAFMEMKLLILSLLTCFKPNLACDEVPQRDVSYIGFGILPPAKDIEITLPRIKI